MRGESVIDTGLLCGPQGIGALVAMPIAGRLTERFGGGRVALVGVSLLCLSTIPLAFIGANTSIVAISLVLVVRGVSIGMSFMPAMTAAFAAMRPEQLSDATPQINVLQRIGGAIGTAILAVVLQRARRAARHAHRARERVRHRLLGGARDRRAVADPLPDAAARRAPPDRGLHPRCACGGEAVCGAPRASRRAGRGLSEECGMAISTKASDGSVSQSEWAVELRELGGAFRRTFRSLSRLRGRDTHLGATELSHAQCELLFELEEHGELSVGELACAAQLTPATVTQMLEYLAAGGHVERARLERDRRVVVSRLTPRGRREIEVKREKWQGRWEQALADVDVQELRAATRVLDRLQAVFEDGTAEADCAGEPTAKPLL